MESAKAPGSFAPENLIKTGIMICALKRHSVPRRHQMIDTPVGLDRRRGRRRRLASSLPYGVTNQLFACSAGTFTVCFDGNSDAVEPRRLNNNVPASAASETARRTW
jgi:hypothetical protein